MHQARIVPGETTISRRSIAMPTVTKNRPTRMSAKRAQIVFDAMPEVAAADHHAGDERTDRQGEAREIGEVGGAQRDEKGRQEEQVARTGPGRAGKHRTDKRPGNDGDGRERDRRQPETPHEIEGVDRCLP